MLLNADDLEAVYCRYAAQQVAAALEELYRPVVTQELPAAHSALLAALERNTRTASAA